MPELPEVETVVRALAKILTGRRITAAHVLHKPSIEDSPEKPACICGRRVQRVFRRGKFIRIDLDDGLGMAIHLRMTGWLGVLSDSTPQLPTSPTLVRKYVAPLGADAANYVRLRFELDGSNDHLVFRDIRTFGRVWCGKTEAIEKIKALSKLGPEPLEITPDEFADRLHARRGRLKTLLLNQEFLAGVGNIYADESLFAAKLHPLAQSSAIKRSRAKELLAAIQQILSDSIRAGGSSIDDFLNPDGEPGWFQRKLHVYGREGAPCPRCGTSIKRIVLGQRGTWFCPRCQKKR
jgi:formamidopyrimidine-DNA glycosylase